AQGAVNEPATVQSSPTVKAPLNVAETGSGPDGFGVTVPVKLPLPRAPPLFTRVNVPLSAPAISTVPEIVSVLTCGPELARTVPLQLAPVWVGTTNVPGSVNVPL